MDEASKADDSAGVRGKRGCGSIVAGLLLILIGIPMLVCPGPGSVVVMAGVAMLAAGIGLARREEG